MTDKPEVSDAEFTIVSEPMVYAREPYKASWLTKVFWYGMSALALMIEVAEDTPEKRLCFLVLAAFWAAIPWGLERLNQPVPVRELVNFVAKVRSKSRYRD